MVDDGDNEPACQAGTGLSRSARQTRRTRRPVPLAIESEELGEIGTTYTVHVRLGGETTRLGMSTASLD